MEMMNLYKIKDLGNGQYSKVYLAEDKFTKNRFAVKVMDISNLDPELKQIIQREIENLKALNHSNIIKLYNHISTPTEITLVLEYCNGGSLRNYLYKVRKKPFSEDLTRHVMKKILEGVMDFHSRKIIHRDLKLDNILINYRNENDLNIRNAELKIIDFNVSKSIGLNKSIAKTVVGTFENMAPEIFKNLISPSPIAYDEKVDIWSLGTLCFEMLFSRPLFKNLDEIKRCNIIIPNSISQKAKNFLKRMLKLHGYERPSAYELLNDEFIQNNDNNTTTTTTNYNTNNNLNIQIENNNMNNFSNSFIKNNNRKNSNPINITNPNNNRSFINKEMKIHKTSTYNNFNCFNNNNINYAQNNNYINTQVDLNSQKYLNLENKYFYNNNANLICSECKRIPELAYKCLNCKNVNYCYICFYKMFTKHNGHFFEQITIKYNSILKNTQVLLSNEKIRIINVIFKSGFGPDVCIPIYSNILIDKLIRKYLSRISGDINNYRNKYWFLINGRDILKYNAFSDIGLNGLSYLVQVSIKNNVI